MLSLYARLDQCSRNVTRSVGRYNTVSYVAANFLQLFLCEQFRVLSPKPREFKAHKPQRLDGVERVRSSQLDCRGRRWYETPKKEKKPLSWLIDEDGSYSFRPFSYTPRGILPICFYSPKDGGKTKSLTVRSTLPGGLMRLLAALTPSTLPSKFENDKMLVTHSTQQPLQ